MDEIEILKEEIERLKEENMKLKKEVKRWKNYSNEKRKVIADLMSSLYFLRYIIK